MSRSKKEDRLQHMPKPQEVKKISYLPRDISLGHHEAPKGILLVGWCLTTDTFQLWESIGEGNAKFLGFVCSKFDEKKEGVFYQ